MVTQGEALFSRVRHTMLSAHSPDDVQAWLGKWQLGAKWWEFVEQATCLFIVGRLIRVAQHYASVHSDSKLIEKDIASFINNDMALNREERTELVRLSIAASVNSRPDCSQGIAKSIRSWAQENRPNCYLCDVNLDFTVGSEAGNSYTLEHVWPRAYGGDSSEQDNLLPACKKCNSARKKDFALWSGIAVQSTNISVLPSDNARERLEGSIKYAIHQRRVLEVAIEKRLTLKAAAIEIGPWLEIPEIIDQNDSGHFFNIRNHRL